jgi:hypothetical protein
MTYIARSLHCQHHPAATKEQQSGKVMIPHGNQRELLFFFCHEKIE